MPAAQILPEFVQSPELNAAVESVVLRAERAYAPHGIQRDHLGLVVLRLDQDEPRVGSFQGDVPFYPASVVKLFYLVFAGHRTQLGKLEETPEFLRALTAMISESNNDATNWVLEVITGAASGPELPPDRLRTWQHKRRAVNRYFRPRGYPELNACQKTWDWGPYGRERQGYGPEFELRNSLTPMHAARLLAELACGVAPRSQWALDMLLRTIPAEDANATGQAKAYTGKVLPAGSKLWSKAGWTDEVRHDAALFELPNRHRYIFSMFTRNLSGQANLVPDLARWLLESLGEPVRRD
jgi:beta-lactamase class A